MNFLRGLFFSNKENGGAAPTGINYVLDFKATVRDCRPELVYHTLNSGVSFVLQVLCHQMTKYDNPEENGWNKAELCHPKDIVRQEGREKDYHVKEEQWNQNKLSLVAEQSISIILDRA